MRINELRHWGIPNMKWGVRRYQNEDGTLTLEGKERYRGKDPVDSFMSSFNNTKVSNLDHPDYSSLQKSKPTAS